MGVAGGGACWPGDDGAHAKVASQLTAASDGVGRHPDAPADNRTTPGSNRSGVRLKERGAGPR